MIIFRPDGQLNYVEDSNGYRLSAGYTDDLLTQLSASNGDSFTLGYNSAGRIATVTDQTGQTNSYNYDATGQYLLSIEDVNGTTSFSYDNPFDSTVVSGITYDDGSKVSYDYDHVGRLQQVIYGEGREALATTYSYDDNGGVTVINPDGGTNQELRNEQGQVSQSIDALGRVTNYSYDAAGNLTGINGELGYSAGFTYDEVGNVVSQTNALNQTTNFTYQADSNKLSGFKDARGNDVLYSYDNRGNLSQITYEDGTTDKYVYNTDGLLTKSVNRRGQEIAYEYNNNYQVTKEIHSDGEIITYEYGANNGFLTSIGSNSREDYAQFIYNQAENKFVYHNSNDIISTYSYDKLGRKTQIAVQSTTQNYITNYDYDGLGRLDQLTDESGNVIVDYDYHPVSGQLVKETNGNGTYTSYSYDLAGQLISLVNAQADDMVNSRFDYTYDNLGRRNEVETLDGTWSYEYDLSGQLTGAVFASTNPDIENQDLTYVYDAAGNRTQTIVNGVTENYSTNNLNQYQTAGTTTYSYDLDGNLTSKTDGNQTWTYSYNDDNRLVGVVDGDNNLTQYEYDAFGNRTATVYNGQRTEYLIDPFGYGDVIAEYDGDGNLIAKYEHGIGLVSRTDASNNQAFYDFDGTGSTAALTGETGTNLNSYNYRPFGEDFYEVETVENSFEYVGQWGVTEEANGLDFMRARFYDSHSGRFVASDPIGLQGNDSNFYRYVGNNPVSYIDPEGTVFPVALGVGIGISYLTGGLIGLAACADGGAAAVGAKATAGLLLSLARAGASPGSLIALSFAGGILTGASICGDAFAAPPPHADGARDGFDDAEDIVITGSPLVLDLDGDGIELTAVGTTNVFFDIDNDGFRESVGWVQPDDGLLVFDRNNDNYINDNSELFGNFTTSGFVELREIDSNNDGFIDAADHDFSNLQIWRDLDTDGRSDVNELYSLAELNITRISAIADNVNIINAGNEITETTFYELGDGTTREIVDAWFVIDQLNSYYDHNSTYNEPVVFTEQILNLPNLRGYGDLPDLQVAMAKDPELVNLVQNFSDTVTSGDVAGGRDLIASILYRWAGVDNVDPAERGKVDAQKLGFLEQFIGRNWGNSSDDNLGSPGGVAQFAAVNRTFDELFPELEIRLLVQAADSTVDYNTVTESYVFDLGLTEALEQLNEILPQAETAPSQTLDLLQAISLIQFIRQQGVEDKNWVLGKTREDQLVGNEANELIFGFSGNDSLKGNAGDDTIDGGAGNDTLEGGKDHDLYQGGYGNDLLYDGNYYTQSGQDTLDGGLGNDTLKGMGDDDLYLFDKGYGHDVIEDYHSYSIPFAGFQIGDGGEDTLRFGEGITSDNLRWNFDGKNLTFTLTDSPDDSLTILNYTNQNYRLENIEVEGNLLIPEEILNSKINKDTGKNNSLTWLETHISFQGLDGDDTITTGIGNDKLWGNYGDDIIDSGNGNDTLLGNVGNDSLNGGAGNDTIDGGAGNDTLEGGKDHDLYQGGDGNDLLYDGNYYTQSGQDTLDGGLGNDTLKGMGDDDLYLFDKGYGHDVIEDYHSYSIPFAGFQIGDGGEDILRFGEGITSDNLRWNFDSKNLSFTLNDSPDDSLTILNYADVNYRIENIEVAGNLLDIEEILNSPLNLNRDTANTNFLEWLETPISFQGLSGNDTITTGDGNDQLWGDDGDDTLYGGSGNDQLNSGEGNDSLYGGNNNDTLTSGAGDDTLYGGNGSDVLVETADTDFTLTDTSLTGNGNDSISQIEAAYITGGAGNNRLIALGVNTMEVTLDGAGGNDTLTSGNQVCHYLRWQ